jgi:hypothetical protein
MKWRESRESDLMGARASGDAAARESFDLVARVRRREDGPGEELYEPEKPPPQVRLIEARESYPAIECGA